MTHSIVTLLTGTVDYAGLFPPANLDMRQTVHEYARYLRDPAHFMLGRLIIPVAKLAEFDEASNTLLPREGQSKPWIMSALVGPDVAADIQQALKFNCRHWIGSELGHAVIDSLEIKASLPAEIAAAMSIMPKQFRPFFEIPSATNPDALIAMIARAGACAKIRTGGVTQDAFPSPDDVARFIQCCAGHRVPFKATAGLHHPIRAEYRLTYDEHPPIGVMYGYLNLFIAAAFAWWLGEGCVTHPLLLQILEETNADTFVFNDSGLTYRGNTLSIAMLYEARQAFAISFGSCSFREPVDDLAALPIGGAAMPSVRHN
jgi:hypothetical protein